MFNVHVLKKYGNHIKFIFLIVLLSKTLLQAPVVGANSHTNSNSSQQVADYLFYNGTILTIDNQFSQAQSFAVSDDLIIAVGDFESIKYDLAKSDHTILVDLNGQTVLPGLIDGHSHRFGIPTFRQISFDEAQELSLSYGYTTLIEKYGKDNAVDEIMKAETENRLRIRINLFATYNDAILDENNKSILLNTWFPANFPIKDKDRMFRIPGIKIFTDGTFSPEKGAWAMSQPFPEQDLNGWLKDITSNRYGDLYLEQNELEYIIELAEVMGYQVAFHSMGDRAINTVLNAIGNVTGGSNYNSKHQIEHNSYLRPDLLQRYANMNMLAAVRGVFPTCTNTAEVIDNFFTENYFNRTWYLNRYNMSRNGIETYLETDFSWPVHEIGDNTSGRNFDPFINLFSLVTRAQIAEDGSFCEPDDFMLPDAISVEEALRMMTIRGAKAIKMDDVLGSIEDGKFADIVVIPSSPLTMDPYDLKDLYAIMTMVGGNIEYERIGEILDKRIYIDNTNSLSPLPIKIEWFVISLIVVMISSKIKQ